MSWNPLVRRHARGPRSLMPPSRFPGTVGPVWAEVARATAANSDGCNFGIWPAGTYRVRWVSGSGTRSGDGITGYRYWYYVYQLEWVYHGWWALAPGFSDPLYGQSSPQSNIIKAGPNQPNIYSDSTATALALATAYNDAGDFTDSTFTTIVSGLIQIKWRISNGGSCGGTVTWALDRLA